MNWLPKVQSNWACIRTLIQVEDTEPTLCPRLSDRSVPLPKQHYIEVTVFGQIRLISVIFLAKVCHAHAL
jgi:hypothetical protein